MDDLNSLKSLLRIKNAQIKSLNHELLSETPSEMPESGMAQKVIQLVKKNKRLIVALEREKAANASLRNERVPLVKVDQTKIVREVKRKVKDDDKLGIAIRKLEDEKIVTKNLKAELLKTQKALVKEVGNVPLDKLLEDQASWKGRAQTIILLKKKIEVLKSQCSPFPIVKEPVMLYKDKLDAVLQELETLKESLGDQTRKGTIFKARIKVLELEISRTRDKMSTLLLKIEKDNDYIQALEKKSFTIDSEEKDEIIRLQSLEIARLGDSQIARIEKASTQGSLQGLLGSSDLGQAHLLKLENFRLLELVKKYESQVLELESKLSQTNILLTKERRKGNDVCPQKDNPKKLQEQYLMLKDENECLKDLISSYTSKGQTSANTYKSILEDTRSLLMKQEIHQT